MTKAFVSLIASITFALAGCASDSTALSNSAAPVNTQTQTCVAASEQDIAALFDRWNQSLQTGDPHQVVANYAEKSVLLATVSNMPRLTPAEKEDYFHIFLKTNPPAKLIPAPSRSAATPPLMQGSTHLRLQRPVRL